MIETKIEIKNTRVHNLKGISVDIPHNKLVVVSGLSGSGKSSLAFDTVYAEGQRRYVESLSAYIRQFLGRMNKPEVDYINGLPPAIAIEQKVISNNPRSTVGTSTEIYEYLKLLFARVRQYKRCYRFYNESAIGYGDLYAVAHRPIREPNYRRASHRYATARLQPCLCR